MTTPTRPAVEFQNVIKDYPRGASGGRRLRAVDGASFRVEMGEVVGLLGPNRAGKTTLVKILLTLCRQTAGSVFRLGLPADDRSTLARVGYVHEQPALPRYLNAREWLEFSAALTGLSRVAARARSDEWLDRVGLLDRSREPIARFSKGMTQRLALAQATLNDPDLLVLDEPSEGLDLPGRRLVEEVVRERANRGRAVLLVSHLAADAEKLCNRVVVLREGKVVLDGTPKTLVSRGGKNGPSTHLFEQALLDLYQLKEATAP